MAWLMTDTSRRFVPVPFGRGWQVLIEDEVTQGSGGEPREVRGEVDKGSRRPRVQHEDRRREDDVTWQRQPQRGADITVTTPSLSVVNVNGGSLRSTVTLRPR